MKNKAQHENNKWMRENNILEKWWVQWRGVLEKVKGVWKRREGSMLRAELSNPIFYTQTALADLTTLDEKKYFPYVLKYLFLHSLDSARMVYCFQFFIFRSVFLFFAF